MDKQNDQNDNYISDEIENDLENILNDNDNTINIDTIKKERDFLNIFTIEPSDYKNKLRNILLSEDEKDLESIEDKILNINLNKKSKKNSNKNKNK